MHELAAILFAHQNSIPQNETTFLATIVNTFGSTYRQIGAKMLITERGQMSGTLSGGCVENDIFQYTKQVTSDPLLISYDATTENEDLFWGFGLGCNGAVQILLEKLDLRSKFCPLKLISQCLNSKEIGAIATIFSVEAGSDFKIGSRLLVYPDNTTRDNIQNSTLKNQIAIDTLKAKQNRTSTVNNYQLPSSSVKVFIEVIKPPPTLLIFGAGRDALPVVELAKIIGWQVTVIDCRAQNETYQRFSSAERIILAHRETISKQISVDPNTVAVVMTHNYFDDREIVKFLLPTAIPYLGLMGSKNRIAKIIQELNPSKIELEKLYSPIGLDLGAETPAEIASAIVAEIQAVLAKRNGSFLKYRDRPLHEKNGICIQEVAIE